MILVISLDQHSSILYEPFLQFGLPARKNLRHTYKLKRFQQLDHSEKEGEEEGEPSVFEEEVPEVLDRAPYYELHEKLTQEHITHKIKNNFLHRKMAEYFKKRKACS